MAVTTGIEWADATWNPWRGCHKVSQGCKLCYMFRDQVRYGRDPNVVVRAAASTFAAPLAWERTGKLKAGSRIFTCSWSDWFIEEADEWRGAAWSIIRGTPNYAYLILTKRPERIMQCLPADWGQGWHNVWLGVSAEDQASANLRIEQLLDVPAAVRFVSAEPLLWPIDFIRAGWDLCPTCLGSGETAGHYFQPDNAGPCETCGGIGSADVLGIHWVITGGESDLRAPRPCDLDWVRGIRQQCQDAGVAFFHKQHGGQRKVGGAWGGRELDGRTWDELPEWEVSNERASYTIQWPNGAGHPGGPQDANQEGDR